MPNAETTDKSQCSLLILLAIDAERKGLEAVAKNRRIPFETIKGHELLGDYLWFGQVGSEFVIASGPIREGGTAKMGASGWYGTAARGMRLREATNAQSIVQLGMAFGVDPVRQNLGDVLVSSSIVAYDDRLVRDSPDRPGEYIVSYANSPSYSAQEELVELFRSESRRDKKSYQVFIGPMLSGGARIGSAKFRDEVVNGVPQSDEPVVGGEMEGIGLSAPSAMAKRPVWCVVKGISDFADRQLDRRDQGVIEARQAASQNAADFVLAALQNGLTRS